MTKKNHTKRALISSAISLFLCFSMLVGTTFAWFTDSVSSEKNKIVAGNLDVELEWSTTMADGSWEKVTAATNVFTDNYWEPGHTEVVYLKVSNLGSLELKYQLGVNIVNEIAGTNSEGIFYLSQYIKYAVIPVESAYANREAAVNAAEAAKATVLYNNPYASETTALRAVAGDNIDYDTVALIVYMPETVGNEANYKTGTTPPEISLGINLIATQKDAEEDSFGKNFDEFAPLVSVPVVLPENPTNDIVLTSSKEAGTAISVPADVVNALPDNVTAISVAASAPVVDGNTVRFDSIEIVDQNENVIDLAALNLTKDITVHVQLPENAPFSEGETVVIYHDGEYMATAIVMENGSISYSVPHLCEVTIGTVEVPEADEENVVKISTAAQLLGFAQSVNAGNYYAGKTVVLTKDIDLKNANWTPIGSAAKDHGFMGNFDGKGFKIQNLSITDIALDSDGYAYAGLFGITEGTDAGNQNYIKDLIIENVNINTEGHIVAAAIAYPYYTTVENITVCGDIAIKGGDYTAGALAYTRRCVNASNITVSGKVGSTITGNITVGGVISDIQMNGGLKANYSNFAVSGVKITGNKCVGGISGIIGGQTLNGATVNNVTLVCSDAHVGVVAGSYDSKPTINKVTTSNVTGATAIAGAPYGLESNGFVIIDGVEYVGTAAAFKEQLETGTVNLACDIVLEEKITIAKGKTVVINLNGNTISGILSGTGNQDLFLVNGNLTVNNGTIELTATKNQSWNAMSTIFDITGGGVVTLDNVVADNKGGTDMNFVAHLNNWGTASLNVTDSTLKATYVAVRVFNSGYDMNNVTIKNSTLSTTGNAAFWVHNYTAADFGTQEKADAQAKLLNFTLEGNTYVAAKAAFRYGMTNAEYYTADGSRVVSKVDELVAALKAGENVVLSNNVTVNNNETGSNGYGATGVQINGSTFDGNGNSFGVNAWNTWDSAINISGGTIQNVTINSGMRGIFMGKATADVYIDNVTINGTIYTFNSDGGSKEYGVYISNSTLNGWTSFSDVHKEVVFTNCEFGEGQGYAYCRPYNAASFVGCNFAEGFEIEAIGAVTFENCTIGGVALTAENLATLVVGGIANATVK